MEKKYINTFRHKCNVNKIQNTKVVPVTMTNNTKNKKGPGHILVYCHNILKV